MESELAVESCVWGTMSTKNLWDASVGEEMPCEWYAVAVMRRSAIVGHVTQEDIGCLLAISGRPAACSLFLADQRQRYYSIMSACARASSSFATRRKQWRPKGRHEIITALTTLPARWVSVCNHQWTTAITAVWSESLWALRMTVLATNVEENDRAMAADGTTKAIVSPSPRWVSPQLLCGCVTAW